MSDNNLERAGRTTLTLATHVADIADLAAFFAGQPPAPGLTVELPEGVAAELLAVRARPGIAASDLIVQVGLSFACGVPASILGDWLYERLMKRSTTGTLQTGDGRVLRSAAEIRFWIESILHESWKDLLALLDSTFTTEAALLEALGRQDAGSNAFPEDLYHRGQHIFRTVRALIAEKFCRDPRVVVLMQDSGPRTSEVMTIVPLLCNLLPDQGMREASIGLIGLLIARMRIGAFCHAVLESKPPAP